ncbi:hypothetical protein OK016_26240 [Vibrio chagasii]|nr:hypothetical protein [Vibrio chagasii]
MCMTTRKNCSSKINRMTDCQDEMFRRLSVARHNVLFTGHRVLGSKDKPCSNIANTTIPTSAGSQATQAAMNLFNNGLS